MNSLTLDNGLRVVYAPSPTNTVYLGSKKLLGLFYNFADYQIGSVKGGQITNFEQFDIDFNKYKYLMETRISGGNTVPFSAIALEELVSGSAEG